jgi:hypothetical protein
MLESTFVLDPLLLKIFLPWEVSLTVSPTFIGFTFHNGSNYTSFKGSFILKGAI